MQDDSALKVSILAALAWDPSIEAAHVGGTAEGGVIPLTGHLGSFGEKHAAVVAATRVMSVKAVVGNLKVDVPGDSRRDDDDIARAAVRAISWQARAPDYDVMLDVEDGLITKAGHVVRQSQREDAEGDVRRLPGIVGLDNQIAVKPHVSVRNMTGPITHAMHRSWMVDPDSIDVSATEGRVRLSETVHAPHEKFIAEATAWAAAGVNEVQNDICVV